MKAMVYYSCGSPEVLQLADIQKPAPGDIEVLIRVRAAAINPLDCGSLKGVPAVFRAIFGLSKPTLAEPGRPGIDVAGIVEAIGRKVTKFRPGDAVFGLCINDPNAPGAKVWEHRQGSCAEYVTVPESALARKPETITFEQAASASVAALTALQGLRNKGHIRSGQQVLINGASGGVGTFAVQIAKSFGAEVTGVCRRKSSELVHSLGADHVIDYTQEDFIKTGRRYDLIFDCVGNHSVREYWRILKTKGVCVLVGDLTGRSPLGLVRRLTAALLVSRFSSRKLVTFLARPNQQDLILLQELMESGKVRPVVGKRYRLKDVPYAIRYLSHKHAHGKVVVTLDEARVTM